MNTGICARQEASQCVPPGKINALGQKQPARVGEDAGVFAVVTHFAAAVIHVDAGIGRYVSAADHGLHLLRVRPQARREACGPREEFVIMQHGVQRHQPAHRRAGDERVFASRQGANVCVDHGLEGIKQPAHRVLAARGDIPKAPGGVRIGRILNQPPVAHGIAGHGGDDQLRVRLVEVIKHSPAGAEGRIAVEEYVVPVEHIQHGKALVWLLVIRAGKMEIAPSHLCAGKGGNGEVKAVEHECLRFKPAAVNAAAFFFRLGEKGITTIVYDMGKRLSIQTGQLNEDF